MENLALISANPVLGLGYSPNSTPLSSNQCSGLPIRLRKSSIRPSSTRPTSKIIFQIGLCSSNSSGFVKNVRKGSVRSGFFASASLKSDSSRETTSVGVNPEVYVPPPSSQFGSRLLWIGVGVGLAALFSWVARRLKEYAMNQAFKTMMNQMGTQNNQFGNAGFPPGMPFPFPPPPTPGPASSPAPSTTSTPSTSPSPVASQASVTVDVSASKVEAAESMDAKDVTDSQTEPKKYAFVDVSPEETMQKSPFGDFTEPSVMSPNAEPVQNGAAGATFEDFKSSQEPGSLLTVEALEKMMEDPAMQKMIYPYLPQEMRDPATFKWMLQNPQYRQQLQDMLNKMGNVNEWDERMLENLKKFDLNSPEVKQQFDQIGMTPEEVISKIMANPDVAMAFQNPRVQQAIMDCSQNPMNIAKYQNDKEVMDVFNKISELFPGVTGSP